MYQLKMDVAQRGAPNPAMLATGAAAAACKEGELGRRDGGEGEGELGSNNNNYMILWD